MAALRKVINRSYADYTRVPETHHHGHSLREAAYRTLDVAVSAHLKSGVPDLGFEERYQIEKSFEIPRHLVSHYDAPVGTGAHKAFNGLLKLKALKLEYDALEPEAEYKNLVIEEISHDA